MWAAGSRALQRGVTLLELLVVVAVMALATAGVGLAIRGGPGAQLEREADRLVALLEAGRAASRASGRPVRWVATVDGFRMEGLAPAPWPERWLSPGVVVQPGAGLVLGPEPVIGVQHLQLSHGDAPGQVLRIGTDGLRPFGVKAGP